MKRNIALLRVNPDLENFAFHRMGEVKCLYFLNRLSGIAQFGLKVKEKNKAFTPTVVLYINNRKISSYTEYHRGSTVFHRGFYQTTCKLKVNFKVTGLFLDTLN